MTARARRITDTVTKTAAEAISKFLCAAFDGSGNLVKAGAGDVSAGIVQNGPALNGSAQLVVKGPAYAIASEAIAVGKPVAPAASGQLRNAVSGDDVVGICMTAASGAGVTFLVDVDPAGTLGLTIPASSLTGVVREVRTATALITKSTTTSIPANARIVYAALLVSTPYSGGTTIKIGRTGSTSLIQDTGAGGNDPTTAATYVTDQDTDFGSSALPVLITIAGSPAAGVGAVIVRYVVPDA